MKRFLFAPFASYRGENGLQMLNSCGINIEAAGSWGAEPLLITTRDKLAMTNQPNTKLIPLTQGKFAIVDAEDFESLSKYKWFAHTVQQGEVSYAYRHENKKTVLMHRVIIKAKKGEMVDHANHNGIDNRKQNLRVCSGHFNQGNRIKRKKLTSQYKGVVFRKMRQKWIAVIYDKDSQKYIGSFKTEREAAKAYDIAAKNIFGSFAYLNFPQEKP